MFARGTYCYFICLLQFLLLISQGRLDPVTRPAHQQLLLDGMTGFVSLLATEWASSATDLGVTALADNCWLCKPNAVSLNRE